MIRRKVGGLIALLLLVSVASASWPVFPPYPNQTANMYRANLDSIRFAKACSTLSWYFWKGVVSPDSALATVGYVIAHGGGAPYDSAFVAANSWKWMGLDTTTAKSIYLARHGLADSTSLAKLLQTLDTTAIFSRSLGLHAKADSANKLQGLDSTAFMRGLRQYVQTYLSTVIFSAKLVANAPYKADSTVPDSALATQGYAQAHGGTTIDTTHYLGTTRPYAQTVAGPVSFSSKVTLKGFSGDSGVADSALTTKKYVDTHSTTVDSTHFLNKLIPTPQTVAGPVAFTSKVQGQFFKTDSTVPDSALITAIRAAQCTTGVRNTGKFSDSARIAKTADSARIAAKAREALVDTLGAPSFSTMKNWMNGVQSSGRLQGGEFSQVTPYDTFFTVAAGQGIIKIEDSIIGATRFCKWNATKIGIPDSQVIYIYVSYNVGGFDTVLATTNRDAIKTTTEFTVGRVYREGNRICLFNGGNHITNFARAEQERLILRGAEHMSGGEISETGTRGLASTNGIFYLGTTQYTTEAESSPTDSLEVFYRKTTMSGWHDSMALVLPNDRYDDGTGSLHTLGGGKYGVFWVYISMDDDIVVVWGQAQYDATTVLTATAPTSLPTYVSKACILAAKVYFIKGGTNFTGVVSAYTHAFPTNTAPTHNDLSGLQGGTADQYYHMTLAERDSTNAVNLRFLGKDTTAFVSGARTYLQTLNGSVRVIRPSQLDSLLTASRCSIPPTQIGYANQLPTTQSFYLKGSSGLLGSYAKPTGGLMDTTWGGNYVQSVNANNTTVYNNDTIFVLIYKTGSPDSMKYRLHRGPFSGVTSVAITGNMQSLTNGCSLKFTATTGHRLNDTILQPVCATPLMKMYNSLGQEVLAIENGTNIRMLNGVGAGNGYFQIGGGFLYKDGSGITVSNGSSMSGITCSGTYTQSSNAQWVANAGSNLAVLSGICVDTNNYNSNPPYRGTGSWLVVKGGSDVDSEAVRGRLRVGVATADSVVLSAGHGFFDNGVSVGGQNSTARKAWIDSLGNAKFAARCSALVTAGDTGRFTTGRILGSNYIAISESVGGVLYVNNIQTIPAATYDQISITGGTVSGTYNVTYPLANAIDGDTAQTSRWLDGPYSSGVYWKYDFGAGVTKVVTKIEINAGTPGNALSFTFYGSNDNTNWTTLTSGTQANTEPRQLFTFSNLTPFRYYRFNYADQGKAWVGLTELRMYQAAISSTPLSMSACTLALTGARIRVNNKLLLDSNGVVTSGANAIDSVRLSFGNLWADSSVRIGGQVASAIKVWMNKDSVAIAAGTPVRIHSNLYCDSNATFVGSDSSQREAANVMRGDSIHVSSALKIGSRWYRNVTPLTTVTPNLGPDYNRCNATGGSLNFSLPAATGSGRIISAKKTDVSANTVTLTPNGAETIDGAPNWVLSTQYSAVSIIDAATGVWDVISKYVP
jgi:hypothetical protein